MRAAQSDILQLLGDDDNSIGPYMEAHRLFSLYRQGKIDAAALPMISSFVDTALAERPDWEDLQKFRADVESASRQNSVQMAEP